MRLFLLPVSTRRTLLYCKYKPQPVPGQKETLLDKTTTRATKLWADWEKKESGWQKKVVEYGNKALKRIPYEEWGLRSVPPLSERRKAAELAGKDEVKVYYPPSLIAKDAVTNVLKTLGTERQALHKKRLIWSIIGMPITAPVAILPVIPNLPFFYLVYRAWAHWKALSGSKHVEFLCDKNLLVPMPSTLLDEIYTAKPHDTESITTEEVNPGSTELSEKERLEQTARQSTNAEGGERLVLRPGSAAAIAKAVELPELELELERAIWQVSNALKKETEVKQ